MNVKSRIYKVIEGIDTPAGRFFDWFILFLIIYSIVTLTIETLPGMNDWVYSFFWYSEITVTLLFTAEYTLRVYIAHRKRDYVFSFGGIIDLLAISPFYITLLLGVGGVDLRSVRAFRLFRLLRLLKVGRYNKALARLQRAFGMIREELVLYFFLTVILLFISATGIYYFENPVQPEAFKSIIHSLWWSVATLTTVGYGDVYPVTLGGRIFTFAVLMVGLGIIAAPAGLIASALSKARQDELDESKSNLKNTKGTGNL